MASRALKMLTYAEIKTVKSLALKNLIDIL